MTSGVVCDLEWRKVASAHSATIAPVNVASAASPPLASATIPAMSVTPPIGLRSYVATPITTWRGDRPVSPLVVAQVEANRALMKPRSGGV
jgi:hypothetical protein